MVCERLQTENDQMVRSASDDSQATMEEVQRLEAEVTQLTAEVEIALCAVLGAVMMVCR